MQQTILALAAVLAFSYYALSRHHDDADLERHAISSEIERAMTDAARNRLALVEAEAFDEDDLTVESIRTTPPTSGLGPDAGETTVAAYDDIDDFSGLSEMRAVTIDRSLAAANSSLPAGTRNVTFAITVAVRYVDAANPGVASAAPTMAKEVHVHAEEVVPAGVETERPPLAVDLRRVYTPAGMAAFARR